MTNPPPKPRNPSRARESSLRFQIGNRIKELRKERGWSQRDLAAYSNVSHFRLSKYESGTHQPPIGALIRIARAFGLLVDVLLPDAELPLRPEDAQLIQRFRRLAALGLEEKELAGSLLDSVFAMQSLLRGPRPDRK